MQVPELTAYGRELTAYGRDIIRWVAIFLFFLATHCALAQMDTATLSGRVLDSLGKSVSAATLEILDVEHGTKRVAFTNDIGFYIFSNVRPGRYRVWVTAPGFRSVELRDLTIYAQDDIQELFVLASGSPLDSVSLRAAGVHVATSGAVGTVIDPALIGNLPLNGLSFQKLFQLTPGFVLATTSFASQGQFSVNGQRTNSNYFAIDGVSANVGIGAGVTPGQLAVGSLPALTAFGGTNSLISTEDVQEFAVLTSSYAPEFGHLPGAQISIVSRAGTREFHGNIFEYLRNDALDANDWFSNRAHLPRAALRQNDFGGILGGPLLSRLTFFFASVEGLTLDQPAFAQDLVPAISARNSASISLRPFVDAYPLPNGLNTGNGLAQATYSFSNPSALNAESFRLDHHSQRMTIFARYTHAFSDIQQRGAGSTTLSSATQTSFSLQTVTAGVNFSAGHVIADGRFNWSRSSATSLQISDNFGGAVPLSSQLVFPPGFTQQNSLFQFLPIIGPQNVALAFGENVFSVQRQVQISANFSFLLRTHVFKAGVDVRALAPHIQPAAYVQQSAFPDIPSVLTGIAAVSDVVSQVSAHAAIGNYSAYVEGTWRPRLRLNLAYGVRWEYGSTPSITGDNGLRPASLRGFQNLPTVSLAPGAPIYRSTWNNFAPRVGLAYAVRDTPGSECVLRFGAGLFYDLSNSPAGDTLSPIFTPFIGQRFLSSVAFPLTATDASPPALGFNPPFNIQAFPPVLRTPYTYQWNLAVEQALGTAQSLTVSSVGAIGHSLLRTQDYIGDERGLPSTFSQLFLTDNSGYSNYNSLQVKFQRRVENNLGLLATYTYSHSLDDVSSDTERNGIPSQFLRPAQDYASSDFDIRHTATVGVSYFPHIRLSIPLKAVLSNWSIDSVLLIRSSPPVDVTIMRDIGFGLNNFRPNLVPGVSLYVYNPTTPGGRSINPAALAVPPTQSQGDLGRNFFRGFPLIQSDLALQRFFRVVHSSAVLFRVEAFNVFNHPNFAPPPGFLGAVDPTGHLTPQRIFGMSQSSLAQGLQSGSFGSGFSPLYQVGGARTVQVALKLVF